MIVNLINFGGFRLLAGPLPLIFCLVLLYMWVWSAIGRSGNCWSRARLSLIARNTSVSSLLGGWKEAAKTRSFPPCDQRHMLSRLHAIFSCPRCVKSPGCR